ncbi:putative lipoprotein [Tannerella forsythia KS16]|nr:putative lipoprotein [Tannerella forsythia KS16]
MGVALKCFRSNKSCVRCVTFAVILPPSSQRTQKNRQNICIFSKNVSNFVVSSKTQGYGNNNRHSTRQFDAPHRPHRRRSMTTIRNAENKYKRLKTEKHETENSFMER